MSAPYEAISPDRCPEPKILSYLRIMLEVQSYAVETATSGHDALLRFQSGYRPDLVLLDVNMPGMDGLETLAKLRTVDSAVKIVMLSCVTEPESVVRAMKLGAHDYVAKTGSGERLDAVLARVLNPPVLEVTEESGQTEPEVMSLTDDLFFVCACPAMRKIKHQAAVIADSEIPVLLLGESGTGKEVIATLIHKLSPRVNKPFLKVNCAAVPGDLLESELFGYEAGAFTGATKSKPGKFELCNGGTILLDEIGEMPPALQAKLLHVLQDREFSRLGGRTTTKVDVRVLSATNINIQEAIATKRLRPDLYYRLNGLSLRLPPLRQRREEIPILLNQFIARMSAELARPVPAFTPRLIEACLGYSWPGNLREFQHFVRRYLILGDEELALAEINGTADSPEFASVSKGLKSIVRSVKADAEAVAIAEALRQTNWKRKEAAALLKISYKALLYKMKQFDIHPPAA